MRAASAVVAFLLVACGQADTWKPERAPLEVVVTDPDVTDAQLMAVLAGAERWRLAVGADVVRVSVGPHAKARCGRVDLSFAAMPGMANGTTIRRECRASIILESGLSPHYMSVVAAHELGHALGMNHDDAEHSLMNSSAPFDGGRITTEDIEYVTALVD